MKELAELVKTLYYRFIVSHLVIEIFHVKLKLAFGYFWPSHGSGVTTQPGSRTVMQYFEVRKLHHDERFKYQFRLVDHFYFVKQQV